MAPNLSGQPLSAEETAEYVAYANRGLAQPAKFEYVVYENNRASGAQYRYATAEEGKAGKAAAEAASKAAEADKALQERITAETAKRAVVAPPARPEGA